MAKLKVYLRKRVREEEWFKDIAQDIRDEFSGKKGIWTPSPTGKTWTHRQHLGKVEFLKQYVDYADYVKVWHPSGDRFKTAQAIGDFTQWIYDHARRYVRKIEIPIR